MNWDCLRFDELGVQRLHEILLRRAEVFIVEQDCAYQDVDGLDPQALHLRATENGELLAYARLLPPGLRARPEAGPVIGRVLTTAAARGRGLGHELAARAVQACARHWPGQGITLFAQAHLQAYYGRAGFVGVGEIFDEDGIPHREMRRN